MDRNSIIGLSLIAVILGVGLYLSGPDEKQQARNKVIRDSLERVEKKKRAEEVVKIAKAKRIDDSVAKVQNVILNDSAKTVALNGKYRDFAPALNGAAESYKIENENLIAYVSNKGAQIEKVELKNYHRPGSKENLVLFEKDSTRFALQLFAYNDVQQYFTDEFYFKKINQSGNSLEMRLETAKPGSYIDFVYSINPGDYMVKSEIRFTNMQNILTPNENQMQLQWRMLFPSQEEHIVKERDAATVYYKQDINSPDKLGVRKDDEKTLTEADIKWVCFRQQFFNSTIIADKVFAKAGSVVKMGQRPQSDKIVGAASCELGIPYEHGASEKFRYRFYFGPNHYNTLKKYDLDLEEIIPTGWSIFSYINKWIVIPLFNGLSGLNMGIVILILTIIVKLLLLPIAYKTYMSSARMRLLKPEMDTINAKYEKNADPMKKQQEQMALYGKAGVSPFSGCIPLLLQFPLLIALFAFVPAAIELRQQGFLWASDLSTYDSIWTFGEVAVINTIYGDHISLFAMLMFASTIIYTYMNSSLMPQQGSTQMPGMKFMMYFMPVIFLAVMNSYAAGLSWYYFLANMFTFSQNWIMKKIVSDSKIRAELESNMKKPKKASGFAKRLEEMAKQRQQQANNNKRIR